MGFLQQSGLKLWVYLREYVWPGWLSYNPSWRRLESDDVITTAWLYHNWFVL